MLTRHLRVDFTQCDFKAPRWFSAWARNDDGHITGIFAIEFPYWFEGRVTIMVLDPRCMSRRVLRAIFTAAFSQAKRLTAEVEPDNRRALRQVQRLGFVYEGYRPLGLEGSRDTIVYGMLREDCKYLPGYKGPTGRAIPAAARARLRKGPLMVSRNPAPQIPTPRRRRRTSRTSAGEPVQLGRQQRQRGQPVRHGELQGHRAGADLHQRPDHRLRAALRAHHDAVARPAEAASGWRPRANTTWARLRVEQSAKLREHLKNNQLDPSKWQAWQTDLGKQDLRQDAGPTDRAGIEKSMMESYNRNAKGPRERAGSQPRGARSFAGRQGYGKYQMQRDDSRAEAARKAYLHFGRREPQGASRLQRRRHAALQHGSGARELLQQFARRRRRRKPSRCATSRSTKSRR